MIISKSKILRMTIFVLITILLVVPLHNAIAAPEPKYPAPIDANKRYLYPITPDSPEWKLLDNLDEMAEACQVSDDILKSMDTDTLIQAVLDYPPLINAYAFNTIESGYDSVFSYANVCQELLSRTESASKLLAKYRETSVDQIAKAYASKSPEISPSTLIFLEGLLTYEPVNSMLSEEEKNEFRNEVHSKYMQRLEYPDTFSPVSDIYYHAHKDEYTKVQEEASKAKSSFALAYTPNQLIRTPLYNSLYGYKMGTDTPQGLRDAASMDLDFRRAWPKARKVATYTYDYNCHSYAWHQGDWNNKYWIDWTNDNGSNGARLYTIEGSYTSVDSGDYPDKIKWLGDHSAIVSSYSSSGAFYNVISKWNAAGLYEHRYDESPFGGNIAACYKVLPPAQNAPQPPSYLVRQ